MKFVLTATLLALTVIPATVLAQPNTFDLLSGARNVGRSTYTLSKAKQGYKLSSRVSYHLMGIESDSTNDFTFSDAYAYLNGSSSSTSTQMHTSFTPNKPRTELVIGMVQGGAQDSRHLVIKPDFTILPP